MGLMTTKRALYLPLKSSLYLVTAGGVVATAFTAVGFSEDSPPNFSDASDKIRILCNGVTRSSRAIFAIASNVVDYKYSLRGLQEGSDEYRDILSEVHIRSAKRILKLCETNKAFYVKAGQFAAAVRQAPKEYTSILSSLQDQAVACQFREIKEVLVHSLKKDLTEVFMSFDEQPIAAASIAQVHRAVLRNRAEVAVKVQYPGLDQLMKVDITTMSFLSKFVAWVFPEYRFGWIVSSFKEAIAMELDFIQEAKNSERTAENFRSNKQVKVPAVFWDLTTNKVMTMEYCAGHKIDDVNALKRARIDAGKVAKTLTEVFASMIFIHGFVHGDPHPGNILVSPEGQKGFSLVLLDHGIYRELDEEFRFNYCQLWEAMIGMDSKRIQYLCHNFGIGKFSRFLPLIFMGKTVNSALSGSKSPLDEGMSMEEKKLVKVELKSLKMEDISSFMESLPPDFLTILRTDGLLRSMLGKLGAPKSIRLLAFGKHAVYGLSLSKKSARRTDFSLDVLVSRLKANLHYLRLRCLLGIFELLSWVDGVLIFFRLKL